MNPNSYFIFPCCFFISTNCKNDIYVPCGGLECDGFWEWCEMYFGYLFCGLIFFFFYFFFFFFFFFLIPTRTFLEKHAGDFIERKNS